MAFFSGGRLRCLASIGPRPGQLYGRTATAGWTGKARGASDHEPRDDPVGQAKPFPREANVPGIDPKQALAREIREPAFRVGLQTDPGEIAESLKGNTTGRPEPQHQVLLDADFA